MTRDANLPDFAAMEADDLYLASLGRGVWLMDDHRWALKVWEEDRSAARCTLIHADFHWDGVYDLAFDTDREADMLRATAEDLSAWIAEGEWIRFDSFIAPAICRGLIGAVHFYCL